MNRWKKALEVLSDLVRRALLDFGVLMTQYYFKFSLALLFLGLFVPGSHADPAAPNSDDAKSEKVDALVRAFMKKENVPGLALAVVKEGKELKVKAYGLADIRLKLPATPNTAFRIGSMSKQFVATAIMMLVEN